MEKELMQEDNPILFYTWKKYKEGDRSLFSKALLKGSLKEYPSLWKEFCDTEEKELQKEIGK